MSSRILPYYMIVMFSYGFLRCIRADYAEEYNIMGKKLGFSIMNGIVYASPFGVPKLFNMFDRIDIYLNEKDSLKYDDVYVECKGICRNKHIFL